MEMWDITNCNLYYYTSFIFDFAECWVNPYFTTCTKIFISVIVKTLNHRIGENIRNYLVKENFKCIYKYL